MAVSEKCFGNWHSPVPYCGVSLFYAFSLEYRFVTINGILNLLFIRYIYVYNSRMSKITAGKKKIERVKAEPVGPIPTKRMGLWFVELKENQFIIIIKSIKIH